MAAFFLALWGQSDAQTLNQSAGWPNPAWTITGEYNADPVAFEADPRVTANFAYDDDDAGNTAHEDNIAAESPVVDLTAAFNANEMSISITVNYGYYYLSDDVLQFQYWDADGSAWVAWPGANIPGNNTLVTNFFCTIPKTLLTSSALNISNFTPTQLAGFKYRISYDDNPVGTDWNYGFCFDSPTITSSSCPLPTGLVADNEMPNSADISWDAVSGIAGFEYVLNEEAADPAGAGTPLNESELTYPASGLTEGTTYYFHLRSNCGSSFSDWVTVSFTTLPPAPANDNCGTAIAIASLPHTVTQDATSATPDGVVDICSGMNDGVWYTFVGDGAQVEVNLENVVGWDPELGVYTGACGAFACVDQVDDGGTGGGESLTFVTTQGTTYYINIGHYGGFAGGTEAEGPFTLNLIPSTPPTPLENETCATATAIPSLPYTTTLDATPALADGVIDICSGMNDGVWYTFVGTGADVLVELVDVQGWDPELGVYTGSCGAFACVEQVDNGGTSGGESLVVLATVVGTTYYINVGHYGGFDGGNESEGPFTLNVEEAVPPTPIDNDSCATATAIASFPYVNQLDATGATNNDGSIDVGCDAGAMNDGAWYTFAGTGNEITVIVGAPNGWDPEVAVYSGQCGTFTCVASADNGGTNGDEMVTFTSETNVTYFINVGHYSDVDNPEGSFVLDVSETLATQSFSGANFVAFPNPVKDLLNVSYDNTIDNVAVYNLLGQNVLNQTIGAKSAQVDLSALTAGSYIVKFTSNDEVQSVKILKQ
ncbi:Por secretion system C-terminal sorting domain-containing protein [Flavobacterium caeni]|uniref:Por secretion system C-terminal sorting domain-containing protein n=2 Tax=Flavobacterium caeni TaxID=490189 RepID=A0A1G5BFK9_9FLAO|nr:Por secretion system C-terminal sorting domain-containing protein [Flavobacterium caeni]